MNVNLHTIKLTSLLFDIGTSCWDENLEKPVEVKIFEYQTHCKEKSEETLVLYLREMARIGEECDLNLAELNRQILDYPSVIPRLSKMNGDLYFKRRPARDNFSKSELKVLNAFREQVIFKFHSRALFLEFMEFTRLLDVERNYLGAHFIANEVADKNGFAIDHNVDEEFWRTVW